MDHRSLSGSAIVELTRIIRAKSYRTGDFTLSSGKKSSYYIDLKATTLHPEGAYWIGKAALTKVREAGIEVDAVGGLTLGADPIATAISLAAREAGLFWPALIVRKEPKKHGTSQYIEGLENIPPGGNVLVLEDVVTTGGSSLIAIQRLREAGYKPVAVLTIVDREEGGQSVMADQGLPLLSLITISQLRSC